MCMAFIFVDTPRQTMAFVSLRHAFSVSRNAVEMDPGSTMEEMLVVPILALVNDVAKRSVGFSSTPGKGPNPVSKMVK